MLGDLLWTEGPLLPLSAASVTMTVSAGKLWGGWEVHGVNLCLQPMFTSGFVGAV